MRTTRFERGESNDGFNLDILPGLPTSLSLTFSALIVAFILAILFTLVLSLKTPVVSQAVKVYITLFTGTPLLVQFFLIYNGPSQFKSLQDYPMLWDIISAGSVQWLRGLKQCGLFHFVIPRCS